MSVVESSVVVTGDAEEVWQRIVTADGARRWWGVLDADVTRVAQDIVVATGSVSRYRMWVDALEPGSLLAFTSAYLGVSPTSSVRLELVPSEPGVVVVRVEERVDTEEPATIHRARQLWAHRLERLAAAGVACDAAPPIAQGTAEIRASRSLDHPGTRPLHTAVLGSWMPLAGDGAPPRWFFVVDDHGPRPFSITRWQVHYDDQVEIDIQVAPNLPTTTARLDVAASEESVRLNVLHSGWSGVAIDAESREVLRDRFVATWEHALCRAAALA